MPGQEIISNPFTYVVLIGFFIWLIPLWHSLRSGSLLAIIEVLALLAVGAALPIMIVGSAERLSEFTLFRALGALQALAGSVLFWLGALLIGLAADLGREFRRAARRSMHEGPAMPDYPRRV
jgi:hypothetical protein